MNTTISHEEAQALTPCHRRNARRAAILPVNGRPFFLRKLQPIIVDEELWGQT